MQENSKLKERISELEARGDVVKVSPSLTETNGFSTNHAPHRQHSTPAKDTARASTGSLVSPPLRMYNWEDGGAVDKCICCCSM
jgi:hypothetical protein